MTSLDLNHIEFNRGDWQLNVSLSIKKGQCIALIGANGAGKSTLLSLISGFEKPDRGEIFIDNICVNDLGPAERPVTMMFQGNNLFSHMSLFDNIALACDPGLKLKSHHLKIINEALYKTQLAKIKNKKPGECSGGEQQRAALARCLCQKKPLFLLDEPFASLDPPTRKRMYLLLNDLRMENNITIILVNHSPQEAILSADEFIFLNDGDFKERGDIKNIFERPKTKELEDYLQFTS